MGKMNKWKNLLIRMKEYINGKTSISDLILYNFTGDGWIILLPEGIDWAELHPFLKNLCKEYLQQYEIKLQNTLASKSDHIGLTLGMDNGTIVKIRMNNKDEYVGRAINIACRLQSQIKDNDKSPENKMLMSKRCINLLDFQ